MLFVLRSSYTLPHEHAYAYTQHTCDCTHTHKHTCIPSHTHTHTCIPPPPHTHTCIPPPPPTHTQVDIQICPHTHAYMDACRHTHMREHTQNTLNTLQKFKIIKIDKLILTDLDLHIYVHVIYSVCSLHVAKVDVAISTAVSVAASICNFLRRVLPF